jgi:hypothetical protein
MVFGTVAHCFREHNISDDTRTEFWIVAGVCKVASRSRILSNSLVQAAAVNLVSRTWHRLLPRLRNAFCLG